MDTFIILSILAFWQEAFMGGEVSADGACKTMVFKEKFKQKALENHVFQTTKSSNDALCKILCYLDNRCLSYNYGTSAKGEKEACELSESDHVKNNEDLVDRPDTVYFRAENSCSCPKDKTCQLSLANSTYQCVCKAGTLCKSTSATTSPVTANKIASSTSETESTMSSLSTTKTSYLPSTTESSPSTSTKEKSPLMRESSLTLPTTTESPLTSPPMTESSLTLPPTTESSLTSPTTTESPLTLPPTTESSLTLPPTTESSLSSPPTTESSLTSPPMTESSLTSPPMTESSFTSPPTTESSLASPPTTESSLTSPPTTESSLTSPPTTESSLTSPPMTESSSSSVLTETITTSQAQTTHTSSPSDCELLFTSPSTSNMIRILNPFSSNLATFTVSFWLKVPASAIQLYIFSFATVEKNGVFSIGIKQDGVMDVVINDTRKSLPSNLQRNNTWQHFVVTWSSSTGSLSLFHNGKLYSSESGLKDNTIVQDGLLTVGQRQGAYDKDFNKDSSMQGNLAGLNVWSSESNNSSVSDLYTQNCHVPSGDMLSWARILVENMSGDSLSKACPATCH